MARKEIKENEILQVKVYEQSTNYRTTIRVVQWNSYPPQLEKRQQTRSEEGWKNLKAKGFDKEDFEIVLKNKEKILKALDENSSQKKSTKRKSTTKKKTTERKK